MLINGTLCYNIHDDLSATGVVLNILSVVVDAVLGWDLSNRTSFFSFRFLTDFNLNILKKKTHKFPC